MESRPLCVKEFFGNYCIVWCLYSRSDNESLILKISNARMHACKKGFYLQPSAGRSHSSLLIGCNVGRCLLVWFGWDNYSTCEMTVIRGGCTSRYLYSTWYVHETLRWSLDLVVSVVIEQTFYLYCDLYTGTTRGSLCEFFRILFWSLNIWSVEWKFDTERIRPRLYTQRSMDVVHHRAALWYTYCTKTMSFQIVNLYCSVG
jgi:hypothetical protein